MDVSFHDGDNFIRNAVSIRCNGLGPSAIARKISRSDDLPVDLDDLRLDLRIDSDGDDDGTLTRMQLGAAAFIEKRTGFVIIPGTYQVDLPSWWSGPLEIMRGPLRTLDSIQYLDETGAEVAADMAGFFVEDAARSFTVRPLSSFTRPSLWSEVRRVRLTFQAGFDLAESTSDDGLQMDDGLRTMLIMLVGHYYQNRELFLAGKLEGNDAAGRDLLGAYRQFW